MSDLPASAKPNVVRTRDFVTDAATFILEKARSALAQRNAFRMALSGGNTPRPVYAELARIAQDFPWEHALLTFSDERCVPPDDEQSNYRMAFESLLRPASVPEQSVLRMRGEMDPRVAAQEYEMELDVLAAQSGEQVYRHDLILLGLGDDGHTASLFPGSAALNETTQRVAANYVSKLDTWRLTFTYPLLSAAREICFLVNGTKQRDLVDEVLAGDQRYPAARVASPAGRVTWILGV